MGVHDELDRAYGQIQGRSCPEKYLQLDFHDGVVGYWVLFCS